MKASFHGRFHGFLLFNTNKNPPGKILKSPGGKFSVVETSLKSHTVTFNQQDIVCFGNIK